MDYTYMYTPKRGLNFHRKELYDLLKSMLAIGLAFTIATSGFSIGLGFLIILIISILTAGIGFLLHEIAHKLVAQYYDCVAYYRSDDRMLIFTIFLSFLGVVFAAPGAVMILNRVSKKKNGIISLAGPATNFILAGLFFLIYILASSSAETSLAAGILSTIGFLGFSINALIGLFNMIPFGNFDGRKVLEWNKTVYGIAVGIGILLFVLRYAA
jgi:Zn-dependent protease